MIRYSIIMGTPWSPTTHFSLLKPLSLSHGISGSISINGIYNHEPLIIVFSSHYHLAMASAASRSTASAGGKRNSTQLSRDISRAGSTKTQDGSAIKLFNYFITEILNMIPLDDLELPHLEEGVENILISYSLWLCDTNIPRNHEKYLSNPDLEPNGYMTHDSLK